MTKDKQGAAGAASADGPRWEKRHRCMRCGGEFACRTAECTAGYDVLPRIVQRAADGSLEVVEHECGDRKGTAPLNAADSEAR